MRSRSIAIGLAASVGVAGCGASSSTISKDRRIARAGLLDLADFPRGWTSSRLVTRNVSNCPESVALRKAASARAVSHEFSKGHELVLDLVAVVPDARQAAARQSAFGSTSFGQCLRQEYVQNFRRGNPPGTALPQFRTRRVSPPEIGDQSLGLELDGVVTRGRRSAPFFVGVYVVRQGRAILFVDYFNAFRPFDAALGARLVRRVVARLRAAGA